MHRRAFLGAALALASATSARAAPASDSSAIFEAYAHRLSIGMVRAGGGRFVASTEQVLYAAHDRVRREQGIGPLRSHAGLAKAARAHACDLALRRYFDHASPEGFTSAERIGLFARDFIGLGGENIVEEEGTGAGADPGRLMRLWMNSTGHRENILRPNFTHLGLAAVQVGDRSIAAAVFGQPFASFDAPIPMAVAELSSALASAEPAIHSYDLSAVGGGPLHGGFDANRPPHDIAPGFYLLRPRLQDGRRFTIVYGPVVAV